MTNLRLIYHLFLSATSLHFPTLATNSENSMQNSQKAPLVVKLFHFNKPL